MDAIAVIRAVSIDNHIGVINDPQSGGVTLTLGPKMPDSTARRGICSALAAAAETYGFRRQGF